jgi:3-oxoacyl-[acyl-carrier-protein] synthase II
LTGSLAGSAQISGLTSVISAACASGAVAVAIAGDLIAAGHPIMVAGGVDAPLEENLLAQFAIAGVLSQGTDPGRSLRPFDVDRSGTVVGEGAGFLVLESLASVEDGNVVAILSGWGTHFEAGERQKPTQDGVGLRTAITLALKRAEIEIGEIDGIILHANGTIVGDDVEHRALVSVLGEHLRDVPCTAIKPITGHCFAGSSAIEAVVAVESLRRGELPPTANCQSPAWEDILVVRERSYRKTFRNILTVSSGFWGNHAALVFSRPGR